MFRDLLFRRNFLVFQQYVIIYHIPNNVELVMASPYNFKMKFFIFRSLWLHAAVGSFYAITIKVLGKGRRNFSVFQQFDIIYHIPNNIELVMALLYNFQIKLFLFRLLRSHATAVASFYATTIKVLRKGRRNF